MSGTGGIGLARVYDPSAAPNVLPRARLLVDRVWPRGIRKDDLKADDWIRDVAPSTRLRKWFGHDAARWPEFRDRYRAELRNNPEAVERCLAWCRKGPVTLLYGARDEAHNQAVVLAEFLEERLQEEI